MLRIDFSMELPTSHGCLKIAPALAAGNSIVLKPDEHSPHSCIKMAELFVEAGGASRGIQCGHWTW